MNWATLATKRWSREYADLVQHQESNVLHRQFQRARLFGWQKEGHIDVAESTIFSTRPPAASTSPGSATHTARVRHAGLSVRCHRYLRQAPFSGLCGFDACLRLNDIGAAASIAALEAETWAFADSSAVGRSQRRRDRHPAVAQK